MRIMEITFNNAVLQSIKLNLLAVSKVKDLYFDRRNIQLSGMHVIDEQLSLWGSTLVSFLKKIFKDIKRKNHTNIAKMDSNYLKLSSRV
jgi:hypothetical protein